MYYSPFSELCFFLYQITTTKTCVKFSADRQYPVVNISSQYRASIKDYYEPGNLRCVWHKARIFILVDLRTLLL